MRDLACVGVAGCQHVLAILALGDDHPVGVARAVLLGGSLREKVWELCDCRPRRVTVNIDTTVSTVYGDIEGARKGHNTKHQGKKGLRPGLCFLAETREYLCGTQRRGATITNPEVARQIHQFRKLLSKCVEQITVHGDAEFLSWETVQVCINKGISFTIGNKRCNPPFAENEWYEHKDYEYNECEYHEEKGESLSVCGDADSQGSEEARATESERWRQLCATGCL